MRAPTWGLLAAMLPGLALAAGYNPVVSGIFSTNLPARLQAQQVFLDKWRNDDGAVAALVEKAMADRSNIPGVYDALSILNRISADTAKDDTRQRILSLTETVQNNSESIAVLASKVHARFGGGGLSDSGARATVNSIFSSRLSDRLQGQTDFFNNWIGDLGAVNLLVDTSTENLANVAGVYDALSLLERAPSPIIENHDLRPKVLALAERAHDSSNATALVASRVHVRFGGNALPTAAGTGASEADRAVVKQIATDQQARSFEEFRSDSNGLTYEQVKAGINTNITKPEFDSVVANLGRLYKDLPVSATVQVPTPDGSSVASFECVPQDRQPSMQRTGGTSPATNGAGTVAPMAPVRPPKDPDASAASAGTVAAPAPAPPLAPVAPELSLAASTAPACPAGTVPIPGFRRGKPSRRTRRSRQSPCWTRRDCAS